MNEYNSMASNYEDQGDYVTACYFYNKVVEIARSSKVFYSIFRINNMSWWRCWG